MNICMMTNTYLPHVGGVARSVSTFAEEFRRQKHKVLVVAPDFGQPARSARAESIVERVAAIQKFNGSDFAVRLPLAAALSERLDRFRAHIVHAHHPFLLGDTALRIAANRNVPVVFTHHTRYEDYTHYVPFDSPTLKEIAVNLSTQFANLCDGVIAPSESIAELIRKRGVETPIAVVPTGIDVQAFASGVGPRFRRKYRIPPNAFVVGHVGRLAPEKNLPFLAEAVALFLKDAPGAWFLVVGDGPSEERIRAICAQQGVESRLVMAGKHSGRALHDAYRAMNVFAFASCSETQGLVLAEAMAAGLPVVALNAPGAREVVCDGRNGFLLPPQSPARRFAKRLQRLYEQAPLRRAFRDEARATAQNFSSRHCASLALKFYEEVRRATRRERLLTDSSPWGTLMHRLTIEWELLSRKAQVVVEAVLSDNAPKSDAPAETETAAKVS
jgi:1,2-diacylglycerol 3-alpha-glucosyltransferase